MAVSKNDMMVGSLHYGKAKGVPCVILEAEDCRRIKIKWQDEFGHEAIVHASALRKGSVKNPYNPYVHNVGYFGVGPYKANVAGKDTKEYKTWSHMMDRCYSPKAHSYADYGAKGVFVNLDWLNYQNFARWLTTQPYWGKEYYQLDKDILGDSMEYSEQKCAYVPSAINSAIRSYYSNGNIANITAETRHPTPKWQVQIPMYGKKIHVGMFNSLAEAEAVSVMAKKVYITELANKYVDGISREVYNALLNWQPTERSE